MSETKSMFKAAAGLPDGAESLDLSPMSAVSEKLVGKRIVSVEATSYNTIKFVLEDGLFVTLTPSGIDGDDLELTIATEAGN
jgi:hypothetical protein